jgi:hypothetical protein
MVSTTSAANEALAAVLKSLAVQGASCVIVEDDLGLRQDPPPRWELPGCTGYMGERIVY